MNEVSFTFGTYLGGAPGVTKKIGGNLRFTDDAVGITGFRKMKVGVDIERIMSIEVVGGDVAKSRAGAAVMLGVGALATKATESRTYVIVHTDKAEQVVFEVDRVDPMRVRGKIGPWMQEHKAVFHDDRPAPVASQPVAPQTDVGDQLAHLAGLHAAGALTDAEFTAAKARIIG
jgi:hypothetical protein